MRASSGVDARFPNVNQTKHCWQNYVDYHKCINAKGEDFKPCRQVRLFTPVFSGDICCADANAVLPGLPIPVPQRLVQP